MKTRIGDLCNKIVILGDKTKSEGNRLYFKNEDLLKLLSNEDVVINFTSNSLNISNEIKLSNDAEIATKAENDLLATIGENQVMLADKTLITVNTDEVMKQGGEVVTIDSLLYLNDTCKIVVQTDGSYQILTSDDTLLATISSANVTTAAI